VNWHAQTAHILERAREIGFAAAGVATVEPMDPASFAAWLDAGYAADMSYLHRHLPLRADLTRVLPGARSVLCVALSYPGHVKGESPIGAVATYAHGTDYHDVITALLEQLWEAMRAIHPAAEGRIFVDAGPLPERELARRAGIGWPGGHGCLIAPALGTRILLGEILTTLPLTPSEPQERTCGGSCWRCLEACPTGALVAPGVVDARRCLSYLTIEHKGAIPEELRPLLGTRLFGCDACQDACPYNHGVGEGHSPLAPAPELLAPDLLAILALTPQAFNARFRGTPLARAKRCGLLRNACIALGNQGDPAALPALCRALQDEEPLVREHAEWAIEQIMH
jgi:epoxyqueuosine reductase